MALAKGEWLVVASADVALGPGGKTLLLYHMERGIELVRTNRHGRKERFPLTPEELAGLAGAAENLHATLSNAGALNADAAMRSPPTSKGSPARVNSPSSNPQRPLL